MLFRIARISLIAMLMLAPLAFGAVEPWAWGGLIAVTAAIFVLWAIGCMQQGEIRLLWSWLYLPALAVLALAIMQLRFGWTMDPIGTREAILKGIAYIAIFFLTQHLWSSAAVLGGGPSRRSAEMHTGVRSEPGSCLPGWESGGAHPRSATSQSSDGVAVGSKLPDGAGGAVGVAVGSKLPNYQITQLPNGLWPDLQKLSIAIAVYAFAMSVFAIIQFFADPGMLYGAIKPRWGGYVFGSYVNHNHYAGLMELLIPLALAGVLSLRRGHPARPFLTFAVFISVVSVFLSGSRAGTTAVTIELALFAAIVLLRNKGEHSRGHLVVGGLAGLALAGLFFFWLDPGSVWKRWEDAAASPEASSADRRQMTLDAVHMSRAHLRHGVGLGAFEVAYPPYQTEPAEGDFIVEYAHNDYAQFAAELGLAAWIVAPAFIAGFVTLAFARLRSAGQSGRSPGNSRLLASWWLQAGAAVAVCGMLIHSAMDFNLHMPANAAWFAACGSIAAFKAGKGAAPQAS
jgi:O-antigen ligase